MIDTGRIEELKREIGDEDFTEVVEIFVGEMQEILDQIVAAPAESTADDFHKLRGSASNLGFNVLADECVAIEVAHDKMDPATPKKVDALYRGSLAAAAAAFPRHFGQALT